MFIACRGLDVMVRLLTHPYETHAPLVHIGIQSIWHVLQMDHTRTPLRDFCLLFSKKGLIDYVMPALQNVLDDTDRALCERYGEYACDVVVRMAKLGRVITSQMTQSETFVRGMVSVLRAHGKVGFSFPFVPIVTVFLFGFCFCVCLGLGLGLGLGFDICSAMAENFNSNAFGTIEPPIFLLHFLIVDCLYGNNRTLRMLYLNWSKLCTALPAMQTSRCYNVWIVKMLSRSSSSCLRRLEMFLMPAKFRITRFKLVQLHIWRGALFVVVVVVEGIWRDVINGCDGYVS
jgi:hypothetical protein